MQRIIRSILPVLLLIGSEILLAAETLRVEAMFYPAWLVRDYQSRPLLPGTELREADLVRTGEGGRVQLVMADSSRIRLSENSRFLVQALPAEEAQETSWRMMRGVFHIDSTNSERRFRIDFGDIAATFGNVEAWGRTDLQSDAICLLKGEFEVLPPAGAPKKVGDSQSCYVKPRGQAALPVDKVAMQQHRLWLEQTGLRTQQGMAVAGGQWQLVLISLTNAARADSLLAEYREMGFAAERKSVVRDGRTLHRLLLPAFESIDAALGAAARIENMTGARDTWVWRKPD